MGEEEGERVTEWERGLPSADDLTPLSQVLIPPGLASAFSISPEPYKTFLDVARASESTFSGLRSGSGGAVIQLDDDLIGEDDEVEDAGDAMEEDGDRDCKMRRIESAESETAEGEKRPRLVWTPQLHKRFVEVVAHLGIKSAVPKTIMQLMNVEGLTRENVASHLQKYRLYLKRMQGGPGGGSSEGSRARPDPPQTNANRNGNGNGNGNSSSYGGNSDGYHPHPQQSHQVEFHPHPGAGMMMQMPMYRHMGGNGGSGSGGGGGSSSNHHHHHFHHHQHQFNGYDNGGGAGGSGAQSGFNAGFGYHGSSYQNHATPSDA